MGHLPPSSTVDPLLFAKVLQVMRQSADLLALHEWLHTSQLLVTGDLQPPLRVVVCVEAGITAALGQVLS